MRRCAGPEDSLRGLKENVIIGKLIPVGSGFETRMKALELARVAAEAPEAALMLDDGFGLGLGLEIGLGVDDYSGDDGGNGDIPDITEIAGMTGLADTDDVSPPDADLDEAA